jgi:excisionase family DNA binding protein
MATRASTRDPGWVSLTEACELLGVSASTVRRWADTGVVRTFVTPGGHRRFSRSALEALLPDRPSVRPSLADLGETPSRVARVYRRPGADDAMRIPWVVELDESRRERFRAYGRGIVSALVGALDAEDAADRTARLRAAEDACTEYGRIAGREGLGAPMTADLFLRFRRPFLAELGAFAIRRDLDAAQTSSLLAEANAALDALQLATLRGWEAGALADRRRPRRAPAPAAPAAPADPSPHPDPTGAAS